MDRDKGSGIILFVIFFVLVAFILQALGLVAAYFAAYGFLILLVRILDKIF